MDGTFCLFPPPYSTHYISHYCHCVSLARFQLNSNAGRRGFCGRCAMHGCGQCYQGMEYWCGKLSIEKWQQTIQTFKECKKQFSCRASATSALITFICIIFYSEPTRMCSLMSELNCGHVYVARSSSYQKPSYSSTWSKGTLVCLSYIQLYAFF